MKTFLYRAIFVVLALLFLRFEMLFQTVGQVAFVIKSGIPEVETIAVICSQANAAQIENEAKSAVVITKKKILVYKIQSKSDIASQLNTITNMSSIAVLVIADNGALNKDSVKFIVQKVGLKKIPVVSVREGDTQEGALLAIFKSGEKIEKHINKKVIPILGVNIPAEFLAECVVDVE